MTCIGFLIEEKLAAEAARHGNAGGRPQVVRPNGVLVSTAVGFAGVAHTEQDGLASRDAPTRISPTRTSASLWSSNCRFPPLADSS